MDEWRHHPYLVLTLHLHVRQAAHTMTSLLPVLRQVAPKLTKRLFEFSHRPSVSHLGLRSQHLRATSSPSINLRTLAKPASRFSSGFSQDAATFGERTSPLGSLGTSFQGSESQSSRFPETSSKVAAYWLLGSAASVFGIVVFGGLTRLTESGYA